MCNLLTLKAPNNIASDDRHFYLFFFTLPFKENKALYFIWTLYLERMHIKCRHIFSDAVMIAALRVNI